MGWASGVGLRLRKARPGDGGGISKSSVAPYLKAGLYKSKDRRWSGTAFGVSYKPLQVHQG